MTRGLQFRPGPFGLVSALLLTTASVAMSTAAVAHAAGDEDRPVAVLVALIFVLGSVFGLASVVELARRQPMPTVVPTVVGLGLAAAFATAGLSPAASSYGVGPLLRLLLAAVAIALVRQTWRLWRPRRGRRSGGRAQPLSL
jgi:hypothetical protein